MYVLDNNDVKFLSQSEHNLCILFVIHSLHYFISFIITSFIYVGDDLVKQILKINPNAAKLPDTKASYPLHLSLYSGKHWFNDGIKEIFEAAPETLVLRDMRGFTPATIASIGNECDLMTIFELIRHDPNIL